MPAKELDLTGQRFGRLVAIEKTRVDNKTAWVCKCDCGNLKIVKTGNLRCNATKSCGCLAKDTMRMIQNQYNAKRTHGMSGTRLYKIWKDIIRRTTNPNRRNYAWYGGRGITVCSEWRDSFVAFQKWATENGYDDTLSIDRIDPDGNYCPQNCRWATKKGQANNKRNNRFYTYKGETKTVAEWADATGIPYMVLIYRLNQNWDESRIFNKPGVHLCQM